MHPNCRHEFLPWHESFSGGEELKKIIEESNHFENLDKNDKLFKLYNADQAFKRQLIKESKEFHYLKNTMGEQMPYQTLGGFRRASRSGSSQYEAVHRNVTQLEKTKRDEAILDFYSKKGYNIQESISRIEDLNRKYLSAVKDKKVEDVGFHRYAKVFVEASNELIGLKTSDGKDINAITLHLPERIIGDGTNSYKPVKISDIKKVLTTGKVRVRAADDVQYRTETFSVSYNPIKKSVTQCNHRHRKKV